MRGTGAAELRQRVPHQRPGAHRAGQGPVHAVLRRGRRHGRRPHRLPAQRLRGLPHPQRRQHRRGRRAACAPRHPRASRSTDQHRDYAVLAIQGPLERRGARGARPAGRPRVHVVRRRGTIAGVELTVCRTGYTGERGYELVVAAERRPSTCGTPSSRRGSRSASGPAASARATRCAPRWATRCTATSCRPRSRPSWRAPAGPSAGTSPRSGARRRSSVSAPRRPCARCAACWPRVAASRVPGMAVHDADGDELGEITSGTFSPTLRQGIALALLEPVRRGWRHRHRRRPRPLRGVHRDQAPVRRAVDQGGLT